MPNPEQIQWIQAMNSTVSNPNKKLNALFNQIESTENPSELLCYQNEIITVLARNCRKKQTKESKQRELSIDLDESFRNQLESLIVGNGETIDLEEVSLIKNASIEGSFRTAKQQLGGQSKNQFSGSSNAQVNSLFSKKDQNSSSPNTNSTDKHSDAAEDVPECLRNVDPKMIEAITNEVILSCTNIEWDQIAGLEHAKSVIKEIVIWPMLRP